MSHFASSSSLSLENSSNFSYSDYTFLQQRLPGLITRKATKKIFDLNVLVVGESGLGKSTLVENLIYCNKFGKVYDEKLDITFSTSRTTKIEERVLEIEEQGCHYLITLVDTPGFLHSLDNLSSIQPVEDYIENSFLQYFNNECGFQRTEVQDRRIHCCLYFISPYGHGLRPVDVKCMRQLQHKVNLVPIISKADCLTAAGLTAFKQRIISELQQNNIDIYCIGGDNKGPDEFNKDESNINDVYPFAVIGSNEFIFMETENRLVRARRYSWGTVCVENSLHCDFNMLRTFLLKTHMQDLKDATTDHYERYRTLYISKNMICDECGTQRDFVSKKTEQELSTKPNINIESFVSPETVLRCKENQILQMKNMLRNMEAQLKMKEAGKENNNNNSCSSSNINVDGDQSRRYGN